LEKPPALLVIDAQQAFADRRASGHPWGNTDAEARIADLLAAFRAAGLAVIHVHHHGLDPADPFHAAAPGAVPLPAALPAADEPVVIKYTSSAFIGTSLAALLADLGDPPLVIAGGAANFCVNSTTRMAGDLGYKATVVSDALINFSTGLPDGRRVSAAEVLALTLADLDGEFAEVAGTRDILARLG
jgi:nicotinamidase-related amidase